MTKINVSAFLRAALAQTTGFIVHRNQSASLALYFALVCCIGDTLLVLGPSNKLLTAASLLYACLRGQLPESVPT